jgi:transcription elongation GreA/GreB family factor
MTFKEKIYIHYLQQVNNKVNSLQQVLNDLKESGSNETKSTAGDKHETALAMLQIEQAQVRTQLDDALEQKAVLGRINPSLVTASVVNGSLVHTAQGYFYLCTALGKANVDGITVFALSQLSPLGKQLMGRKKGDQFSFNNINYKLESVE